MFGQRWNLKVTEPLEFGSSWEEDLHRSLSERGRLFARTGMDYLVLGPFLLGKSDQSGWQDAEDWKEVFSLDS